MCMCTHYMALLTHIMCAYTHIFDKIRFAMLFSDTKYFSLILPSIKFSVFLKSFSKSNLYIVYTYNNDIYHIFFYLIYISVHAFQFSHIKI